MTVARDAEGFPELPPESWAAVEAGVRAFEDAWSRGERPGLGGCVGPDDPSGGQLLVELAHTELELRVRAGEPAQAEEYFGRFPELAADPLVAAGLLETEYAARREVEPGLGTAEYARRFPGLFDEFLRLVELERRQDGMKAAWADEATEQSLPDVTGYEPIEELGRGGMGVVYTAIETRLGRRVALKTVRPGAGAEDAERLRREASAAAALEHPNVARVYHVFDHAGVLYVAGEYLGGGSLAQKTKGEPLPAGEAAALLEPLARAVAYAHAKGIVHRDLKPQNVLLAADGTPKVCDFGLAKREGDDGLTRTGLIAGTPSYMAPEQAADSKEVGPPADVWALGVIFYELLTGRPPFRGAAVLDTLDLVRTNEPVPPSRLVPRLPRDLETVCLRCLEKDPARRYASAAALAEDLARFLRGEPVLARPVGRISRSWRWARRHRAVAGLSGLLAGSLLLGTAVSTWQATRAKGYAAALSTSLVGARESERKAAGLLSEVVSSSAIRSFRDGNVARADELLRLRSGEGGAAGFLGNHVERLVRAPGRRIDRLRTRPAGPAFSPDGRLLAVGGGDGIRLYEGADRSARRDLADAHRVNGLAFSPDGKTLVSAHEDGSVAGRDASSGTVLWRTVGFRGAARQVGFAADGTALAASGAGGRVVLLSPTDGTRLTDLVVAEGDVVAISVPPDGRTLLTAADGKASAWDLATRERRWELQADAAVTVAVSPDGRFAAFGSSVGELFVAEVETGRAVHRGTLDPNLVELLGRSYETLAFLPDGRLAVGEIGGEVRLVAVSSAGVGPVPIAPPREGGAGDEPGRPARIRLALDDLLPPKGPEVARLPLALPDGRFLGVGQSDVDGERLGFLIFRLLPDGTPDKTFGRGGRVTVSVGAFEDRAGWAAALPDGRIVVAGWTTVGSSRDVALVRLLSDGSLDETFGRDGRVVLDVSGEDDAAASVAVLPDGALLMAAQVGRIGRRRFGLLKLSPAGELDPAFGDGGVVLIPFEGGDDVARSLAVAPDGRAFVAGQVHRANDDVAVIAVLPDGSLDPSFGAGGVFLESISPADDEAVSVALQPDGSLVVAGSLGAGLRNMAAVLKVRNDGRLDASFGMGGVAAFDLSEGHDVFTRVVAQPDGRLLAAGHRMNSRGRPEGVVVRCRPDGSPDEGFGRGGIATAASVEGERGEDVIFDAFPAGDRIVAVGSVRDSRSDSASLLRFTAAGAVDPFPPGASFGFRTSSPKGPQKEVIRDASGRASGTAYGAGRAEGGAPGSGGGCLAFDGDGDRVTVPLPGVGPAYGVSFWFRTTDGDAGLLCSELEPSLSTSGHNRDLFLERGNLCALLRTTRRNERIATTGRDLADGRWHHVAHTCGPGTGQRLYVDGELADRGSVDWSYLDPPKYLQLGYSPEAHRPWFTGRLDEVRIFDHVLRAEEAGELAAGREIGHGNRPRPTPKDSEKPRGVRAAWKAHDGGVSGLAASGRGELATVSRDGEISVWRPDDSPPWSEVAVGQAGPDRVAWVRTAAGPGIAAAHEDEVRLFDPRTRRFVASIAVGEEPTSVSGAAGRLFVGTPDGGCATWDLRPAKPALLWRSKVARRGDAEPGEVIFGNCSAAADGANVVARVVMYNPAPGVEPDLVVLFDGATGALRTELALPLPMSVPAIFPDGRTVVVGRGTDVLLLDAVSLAIREERPAHHADVVAVAAGPGGRFASGDAAGRVVLWDFGGREPIRSWTAGGGPVDSLAFSPDGRMLLTGKRFRPPDLWDAETGREVARLGDVLDSAGRVREYAPALFSPDGDWALAGSGPILTLFDGRPLTPPSAPQRSDL